MSQNTEFNQQVIMNIFFLWIKLILLILNGTKSRVNSPLNNTSASTALYLYLYLHRELIKMYGLKNTYICCLDAGVQLLKFFYKFNTCNAAAQARWITSNVIHFELKATKFLRQITT